MDQLADERVRRMMVEVGGRKEEDWRRRKVKKGRKKEKMRSVQTPNSH